MLCFYSSAARLPDRMGFADEAPSSPSAGWVWGCARCAGLQEAAESQQDPPFLLAHALDICCGLPKAWIVL